MIKNLLNLSIVYFFLHLSFPVNAQLQKLYLNPKAAGNEKQSNILDSIRFFPLEPHSGVTSSNSGIQVGRDKIILTTYSEKAIFIYSKDGSFLKKIPYKHLGESFYPQYHEETNQLVLFGSNKNFSLTTKDMVDIEMHWDNPRNRKYYRKYVIDLDDTSFAMKKVIPQLYDLAAAKHLYDDRYIHGNITTSKLYEDSLGYEMKILQSNKVIKGFFPYNRISEPRFDFTEESVLFNEAGIPQVFNVTRPFCDTIYRLERDSIYPVYQLVLPLENTLPRDFQTRTYKNSSDRVNYERNNAWLFKQVYLFYETPGLIYIAIGFQSNFESYIYNKETKASFKASNIKGDSSHYNLHLLSRYGATFKNGKFHKLIKAGDLISFFEKNKNVSPPPELVEYLQNNPPTESPVVVSFKLKN